MPLAGDWPWSSYRRAAGLAEPRPLQHLAWVLAQFGTEQNAAARAYCTFVAEGFGATSPWEALATPHAPGGTAFRDRLSHFAEAAGAEVPRRVRRLAPIPPDTVRRDNPERGAWMTRAYREHGYTMREIAKAAGLHYSSVSKIIKTWEQRPGSTSKI